MTTRNARLAGGTLRPQRHARARHAADARCRGSSRRPADGDARLARPRSRGTGLRRRPRPRLVATALAYAIDLDTRELVPRARHAAALAAPLPRDLRRCPRPRRRLALLRVRSRPARRCAARRADRGRRRRASAASDRKLGPVRARVAPRRRRARSRRSPRAVRAARGRHGSSASRCRPHTRAALDAARRASVGHPTLAVTLRGPRGSGRRAAALSHSPARSVKPLLVAPIPARPRRGEGRPHERSLRGAALAAARLRDALPYLADADALYDERGTSGPRARRGDRRPRPGVIVRRLDVAAGGHLELRRPQLLVAMPRAELGDREHACVARAAPPARAAPRAPAELAARYVIGPGAIADVVGEADAPRGGDGQITRWIRDALESRGRAPAHGAPRHVRHRRRAQGPKFEPSSSCPTMSSTRCAT